MNPSTAAKRATLRTLHASGCFVIPNPWDIGTARMLKKRSDGASLRNKLKPGRGRPPVHQETWSKVSVVLFDRQIVHLDRLATDIRGRVPGAGPGVSAADGGAV